MIRTLLFFTLLIGILILNAIPTDLRFAHMGVKEGLPSGTALCMMEDSNNFLWVGTSNGLARFDGVKFSGFTESDPGFRILESAHILDIQEDHEGNIWVATFGEGLACYNRNTGQIKFLRNNPKDSLSLPTNEVTRLAMDPDSNLWVATTQGLCRLKPHENSFRIFRQDSLSKERIVNDYIYTLLTDRKGRIWIGTPRGMSKLTPIKEDRYKVENYSGKNFPSTSIFCLSEGLDGSIWIGFVKKGYGRFDPQSEAFTPFPSPGGKEDASPYRIYPDKNGKIWIGYLGSGLSCLDINTREIQTYVNLSCENTSLPNNWVFAICPTRNGRWWLAHGEGVSYVRPYGQFFKQLPVQEELELKDATSIHSLFGVQKNQVWISTSKGVFSRKKNTRNWNLEFDEKSIERNQNEMIIHTLFRDSQKRIWIGTESGGPIVLNNKDRKGTRISYPYLGKITDFYEDEAKRIWIATDGFGLACWESSRPDSLTFFMSPSKKKQTVKERIRCIKAWGKEKLLLGTYGEGVWVFDLKEKQFAKLMGKKEGLSSDQVYDIVFSQGGGIWVATRDGLNYIHPNETKVSIYKAKDGLPDNVIKLIIEDEEGNIWASTQKGIAFFDVNSQKFISFDQEDGLPDDEIGSTSIVPWGEELLFLSSSKIFSCNPSQVPFNQTPPEVILTGFTVLNEPYPLPAAPERVRELTIDYKDYTFSFEFATPSVAKPDQVSYLYKMQGVDEEWIPLGNRRSTTYTQISPGDYIFQVKAKLYSSEVDGEPLSINVHIRPAFWQTLWFRMMMALLFLLVILAFLWLAKRQLDARHQQELAEKSTEYKSQFLANMSHEIRTPMHSVLSAVDLLSNSNMDEQQKRYLQGIKYAGNNLLGLINDILDFSKIESGKIQFNHTPFNLVEVITYVKKTLANASREQRTELDVRMAKTLPENVVGDKTRLGQILLNLLGNGIKFSPGGKVLLEIENESFSKGIYTLKFKVTDNGVGIPREELGRIFESFHQAPSPEILLHGGVGLGLAITKQLIVQQGGEINVESIENEGTTFTFFIPFTSTKVQLESTQSPSSIVASKPKIEKLLLVEDIDLNRELTEDILKHLFPGVEIASAASGQEALDQLDKGFLPDVILMDIRMPEMDGLTCTAHIRKRYDPLMPVFALTASATHPEIQRCWMAGLDGVLPKPFTPQQLVMELDNLLQPDISAESLQVDYDVLVGFLGKDETRVNRYIAAARGEVYRHFQDVRIALAEDNKSQLKVSMHSLKTIFQYLGVTALADLFREAENAIDEASKEKISEMVVKAATHLRVFLFHYRLNVSL